jgi:predicted metalloprotease with PDZ domain
LRLKQYRSRLACRSKRFDPRTWLRSPREERYASHAPSIGYRRPVRVASLLVFSVVLPLLSGCGGAVSGSMGAVLGRDNDTRSLYVREVPPGLGAASAGLLPGDQIVMIEGLYVRDLDAKTIHDKLRGEVGSTVALTILRRDEVLRVRVTRGAARGHEAISPRETRLRE